MIINKFTRRQAFLVEFFSKFNFIIFCSISKNNIKSNTLIWYSNNNLADNYNN